MRFIYKSSIYSAQICQQVLCLFKQYVTSQSETFLIIHFTKDFSQIRETMMMTYMQKLKQTSVMWQWKLFTEDRQLTCVIVKGNMLELKQGWLFRINIYPIVEFKISWYDFRIDICSKLRKKSPLDEVTFWNVLP